MAKRGVTAKRKAPYRIRFVGTRKTLPAETLWQARADASGRYVQVECTWRRR